MCLDTNIDVEIPFDYYHRKSKNDGVLYKFIGCNDCSYSYKCKAKLKNKDEDYRYIELVLNYEF